MHSLVHQTHDSVCRLAERLTYPVAMELLVAVRMPLDAAAARKDTTT